MCIGKKKRIGSMTKSYGISIMRLERERETSKRVWEETNSEVCVCVWGGGSWE